MSPQISIIIPTLNEAESLAATLSAIRSDGCSIEVIVVDGGSDDATLTIAERAGCRTISADHSQRAYQMNLGAQEAKADALLFLHADTRLPPDGVRKILESFSNEELIGGGFERVFDSDSAILKLTCRLAAGRSRALGIFLGDQGIFVRRDIFKELGGFAEERRYAEDLDFSLRLRRKGEVVTLAGPAISSARRFEKRGPLLQSLIDLWLTAKIVAGGAITRPPSRRA